MPPIIRIVGVDRNRGAAELAHVVAHLFDGCDGNLVETQRAEARQKINVEAGAQRLGVAGPAVHLGLEPLPRRDGECGNLPAVEILAARDLCGCLGKMLLSRLLGREIKPLAWPPSSERPVVKPPRALAILALTSALVEPFD